MNAFGFLEIGTEQIVIPKDLNKYGITEELVSDTTKSQQLMESKVEEDW